MRASKPREVAQSTTIAVPIHVLTYLLGEYEKLAAEAAREGLESYALPLAGLDRNALQASAAA